MNFPAVAADTLPLNIMISFKGVKRNESHQHTDSYAADADENFNKKESQLKTLTVNDFDHHFSTMMMKTQQIPQYLCRSSIFSQRIFTL